MSISPPADLTTGSDLQTCSFSSVAARLCERLLHSGQGIGKITGILPQGDPARGIRARRATVPRRSVSLLRESGDKGRGQASQEPIHVSKRRPWSLGQVIVE
jgi:hypothetical protein